MIRKKEGFYHGSAVIGSDSNFHKQEMKRLDSVAEQCKSIIEENRKKLTQVLETHKFHQNQLTKAPSVSGAGDYAPVAPATKRQKYRMHIREQILTIFQEMQNAPFKSGKGLMIGEIREILIAKDSNLKISQNTIASIVDNLLSRGTIKLINPDQIRAKRFSLNDKLEYK